MQSVSAVKYFRLHTLQHVGLLLIEPFRFISRHPVVVPASVPFAFHFLSLPRCPIAIGYPFGEREWRGQVVVSSWLFCNFGRVTLFLNFVYVTSSPAWWTGRFLRA